MFAQTTKLLELVANFGIVAGLILVAVQIRQDEDIARRDQFTELNTLANAYASRLIGENPAHAMSKVFDPDSLTPEDILILDSLYMDQLGKAIRLEDEFRESGLPAYEIGRWLGYVSNPFGYAWWQVNQQDIARLMPSYAKSVNAELSKLTRRTDAREYDRRLVSEMKRYVASLERSAEHAASFGCGLRVIHGASLDQARADAVPIGPDEMRRRTVQSWSRTPQLRG